MGRSLSVGTPLIGILGNLDNFSGPLWRRIAEALRRRVVDGSFQPGARLPSDRQLADAFSANRLTARKALASLEQQGLVRIEHGSGTYVTEKVLYPLGEKVRFNQNLRALNIRPSRRVLRAREVPASEQVADALSIATGLPVLEIDMVSFADDRPISTSLRYFPLPRFAGLYAKYKASESFTVAMAELGVLDYRRRETLISGRFSTDREARRLKLPRMSPVLEYMAVDVDLDDRPVACILSSSAADRVTFVLEVPQRNISP